MTVGIDRQTNEADRIRRPLVRTYSPDGGVRRSRWVPVEDGRCTASFPMFDLTTAGRTYVVGKYHVECSLRSSNTTNVGLVAEVPAGDAPVRTFRIEPADSSFSRLSHVESNGEIVFAVGKTSPEWVESTRMLVVRLR